MENKTGGSTMIGSQTLMLPHEKRPSGFYIVANHSKALFWKNITLQRRNYLSCACQIIFPLIALVGLVILNFWVNSAVNGDVTPQRFPLTNPTWFVMARESDRPAPTNFTPSLIYAQYPGVDVGRYDSDPAGRTGLLGGIDGVGAAPNDTIPIRFIKFEDNSEDDFYDLDLRAKWLPFEMFEVQNETVLERTLFLQYLKGLNETGGYVFRQMDLESQQFDYTAYTNLTVDTGLGAVQLIAMITTSLTELLTNGTAAITQAGIKAFPIHKTRLQFDVASFAGAFFYSLILHFLLPSFMATLVYEKEHRQREMMKMMGLSMKTYWIVTYLFCFALYLGSMFFLIIGGWIVRFRFYTINNFGIYFVLFFLWGHVLIALAFALSTLFTSSRTASVVGYLWVIAQMFIGQFMIRNIISNANSSQASLFGISVVPSFALYRALIYLGIAVDYNGPGIDWSSFTDSQLNVGAVFLFLIVQWAILMLLAFYLDQVWPGGYGVKRHPLFLFQKSTYIDTRDKSSLNQAIENGMKHIDEHGEAPDVKAERLRVYRDNNIAVRIVDLGKTYSGGKKALHNLALGIDTGECLGILGHNGAGKTTLINILCGLYEPSKGVVDMYGYDMKTQIDKIHQVTGVCPQHDILWNKLTGAEHLNFYGGLKGLTGKALKNATEEALKKVKLWDSRNKLSKAYSGGMKRRLSVAMAMVGHPKIVFLDEPSTGLDPASRETLWEVINEFKKNCSIILTTHSMEEAEALCNRLAIFSAGKMHAVGVAADLKGREGGQYKLMVSVQLRGLDAEQAAAVKAEVENFVLAIIPDAELLNELAGTYQYQFAKKGVYLSKIFESLEANRERLRVTDWALSNTTLEEVFIHVTEATAKQEVLL